jgi:asparagine synthase (glutamine-hydrolysing)
MCGIAGFLFRGSKRIIAEEAVRAIERIQAHRGPDDKGIQRLPTSVGTISLGHRRLAIIDLSPAGHQPMEDPQTGNWITYNGEIYNFQDLRDQLEGVGQAFRTKTDTEVILKAYATWGRECLKHLRGIFAFGLWDKKEQALFLARDHLGVKPVYYYQRKDCFIFASEVRALLASGFVPRKLDINGLYSYLAYGSVQDPYTLIEGVKSLLPGHFLEWKEGGIHIHRYWQLPPPEAVNPHPPADVYDQIAERLKDAVHIQLISDVPLGAFLSGGIDSTAIAALMHKTSTGPVKTFSIVFDEAKYDERKYSRHAAEYIGTDHTEIELSGETVRNHLSQALAAYDQPCIDGLNTYFISKVTKEAGLTVALSGAGGDELFGGYDGYRKSLFAERWGRPIQALASLVPVNLQDILKGLSGSETARKGIALLSTKRHPYFISRRLFSDWQIDQLLHKDLPRILSWEPDTFGRMETEAQGYDPINRASAFELQTYMLSTLLRDTDQMSMAHALEVRVPLIDHKLVEFLFTLPGHIKVDKGVPKPLLTKAMGDSIPSECVFRPKLGFELPFQIWLRQCLQKEMAEEFLNTRKDKVWPLAENGLSKIWQEFQSRRVNWSRVWGVFVLKHWVELWGP